MQKIANFVLGRALEHILLPLGDRLFQQDLMPRFRELQEAQWWDAERIRRHRDTRLQQLLELVYCEVPFYKDLWDRAGVRLAGIRTAEDLPRLPLVTKDMLRATYPRAVVRETGLNTFEARTSGSTGKNFVVLADAETAGRARAATLLAMTWSGWRIGTPYFQNGMNLERSLDRKLKDILFRCAYVPAFDLSEQNLAFSLELIQRHGIRYLMGYPSGLYCLARYAAQQGWAEPLAAVVTWGDTVFPHYRATIEKAFRTRLFDTYGCAELIQVAAQCGVGTGYHIHSLDTVVEFADSAGNPVGEDQPGEIVVTRLHPGPLPLIRYRLGDTGIRGAQEPCACGRGLARMQSVEGRITDIVKTPSGNRLIVHFFTGLMEHFDQVDCFQVLQRRIDSIELLLVANAGYSSQTGQAIVRTLKQHGADDLKIELRLVDSIPASPSGKRRFVISHLSF